jgi:hypothetical protein
MVPRARVLRMFEKDVTVLVALLEVLCVLYTSFGGVAGCREEMGS